MLLTHMPPANIMGTLLQETCHDGSIGSALCYDSESGSDHRLFGERNPHQNQHWRLAGKHGLEVGRR